MNTLTKIIYTVNICLIIGLFSNCQNNNSTTAHIFRYNQSSGISSLDPIFSKDQATMWAVNQIFNGLVQMDDSMHVKPCIARSWDISPDGKTYLFHLRPDIYFHDHPLFANGKGARLTASDVVYSFSRLLDTTLAAPGRWVFDGKVNPANPFVARNDTTFELNLIRPFPPMLYILTMQYCSIVPAVVAKPLGREFRASPIGTGPFRLKIWRENEILVLLKNTNYFEKDEQGQPLPHIDGVKITFMGNKRNEYLKFIEGKLDLLSGLDPAWQDDLLTPEGKLKDEQQIGLQLLRTPYLNTEYFGILQQKNSLPALNDRRVRQAINYSIDKAKLVRYLRNNIGIPAEQGFVPPSLPPFNSNPTKGYTYNPTLAIDLLKQAGYTPDKPLKELVIESTASYQDIAIFVQKQLAEVGIIATVQPNTGPILRERAARGEVPFFRASWIGDYPDAENYLAVLYGPNSSPPNYTRFNNAAYNTYYSQSLNNPSLRYKYYQKMDSILVAEAPIVPLYYDEVLRFINKRVQNLGINGFNMLQLKNVVLTD